MNFREREGWLRYDVNRILKEKHKDLFEPVWKSKIKESMDYLFDRERWWLIILVIFSVFMLSLIDINSLDFLDISYETAKFIIDQRTANIAAIISMTLAVVGFLISNLAIKESFAYGILFKHSKLYPIIYFTLGTIGCLIIISTLRNDIEQTYYFPKLVVTGTYMVLIVLILIGYLFRTIIHFTNSKRIWDLLEHELINEAKRNIKAWLIIKYSKQEYNKFMKKHNLKIYDFMTAFSDIDLSQDTNIPEENVRDKKVEEKIVKDVNLYALSVFIYPKRTAAKIYYSELALDSLTTESDNYIWVKGISNSENDKKALKKCLILEKKQEKKQEKKGDIKNDVRKHFDEKLEEWASKSEYRNLDGLLKSYTELYKLQMKNQA